MVFGAQTGAADLHPDPSQGRIDVAVGSILSDSGDRRSIGQLGRHDVLAECCVSGRYFAPGNRWRRCFRGRRRGCGTLWHLARRRRSAGPFSRLGVASAVSSDSLAAVVTSGAEDDAVEVSSGTPRPRVPFAADTITPTIIRSTTSAAQPPPATTATRRKPFSLFGVGVDTLLLGESGVRLNALTSRARRAPAEPAKCRPDGGSSYASRDDQPSRLSMAYSACSSVNCPPYSEVS